MTIRLLLLVVALLALTGCGTLQVGIESATEPAPVPFATATRPPASRTAPAPTAIASPTNTPTVSATLRPTTSPSSSPAKTAERINFPVGGTNFTFTTRLADGTPERYVLQILANQMMTVTTSRNVTVEVVDAQNNTVKPNVGGPGQWQGTIPQKGDYTIVLRGGGFVTVSIEIPPAGQ